MSEPFLGEIRMAGFNFAPVGWLACNGATLPISQYQALFALLGTMYGGDGVTTFALPNLQGRIPFHQGASQGGYSLAIGQMEGSESVTLLSSHLPAHTHTLTANSSAGTQPSPANGFWAKSGLDQFSTQAPAQTMAAPAIGMSGSNLPHDNLPPFLVVNFIIAFEGIFPSQN